MSGCLITVSRELADCKLELVGVQEGRWRVGDTDPTSDYTRCLS
jgi:phosphoribosylaminoimidazole-succinocarboxamide synthase